MPDGRLLLTALLLTGCAATPAPANPAATPAASRSPLATPAPTTEIQRLAAGSDFGLCAGYCHRLIEVTPQTTRMVESASDKSRYPDRVIVQPTGPATWNKLLGLAQADSFYHLPETVGCPDCADGGAEWLEFERGGVTKRVTFETNRPPEQGDLLVALKDLYNLLHTSGRFEPPS